MKDFTHTMSALHWICALTLALVCCLSAQPVKQVDTELMVAKFEIFKQLESLKEYAKKNCPDDTKLYSPTDIREDCLSSALNCTQRELEVLINDCDLTGYLDYINLVTGLANAEKKTSLSSSSSSSSCKVCESYPEKDVQQFLDAIKSLVERWGSREG